MYRSQLLYLTDIADAMRNIRSYVGDRTFKEFCDDQMRVDAVIRNFEIIGEAVKKMSDDLKKEFPKTTGKRWQDFAIS